MLYRGKFGESLVNDTFLQQCVEAKVEAQIQPFPNPGDPFNCMRVIRFKNFSSLTVKVTQHNFKKQQHIIPENGELTIMIGTNEHLPNVVAQ